MKIYTRNGDKGETGLPGAKRVSKSHLVIEVCGSLDETNCHIGSAIAVLKPADTDHDSDEQPSPNGALIRIQNDLFDLGSRVASSLATETKIALASLDQGDIERLESWIDHFDSPLPPLQNFILPGGSVPGGQIHLARTVCRRAERRMVDLMESGTERDLSTDLAFLNRLGDLLFVLARRVNQMSGCEETLWQAAVG